MLASSTMRLALVVALAFVAGTARADVHGVPLPKGSRADGTRYKSSKAYRDTVEFVTKWLRKQGLEHEQIGPYRARGVDVTRFLSQVETTAWLAIHVVRHAGTTWISVVERPP